MTFAFDRSLALAVLTCGLLATPAVVTAAPITIDDATIVDWTSTSIEVIVDGTSNTIVFGENVQLDVCGNAITPVSSITDGTSNTIVFGETINQCWNGRSEFPLERGGPSTITDGTSNTILIGESATYLFDSDSRVDVCASNVSITDGTSNTLFFGENTVCFAGARIGAVPEPAVVSLVAIGGLLAATRRSRQRRSAR